MKQASIFHAEKNSYYLPNPCDESFETLKNYENKCDKDLFFGMSHGVHRGKLKPGKTDKRELFINTLMKNCEKSSERARLAAPAGLGSRLG